MAANGLFSNFPGLQEAIYGKNNNDHSQSDSPIKLPFSTMTEKTPEPKRPESPISESGSDNALVIDAPEQAETATPTPSTSHIHSPVPGSIVSNSDLASVRSLTDDVTPMYEDPTLPPGWSRRLTQRTMGASAGKYDVYIFSPDKKKIRSKTDLMLYLSRNNLDLNPDDFDFTVRGRHNTPPKRPATSRPRTCSPKKPKPNVPKPETSKAPKLTKPKSVKISKAISSNGHKPTNNSTSDSQSHSTSGPKLVVKFNFPVARMKRSNSMKTKKSKSSSKKKPVAPSRQSSQTSQTSLAETFEVHEDLGNGQARLTNGLDVEEEFGGGANSRTLLTSDKITGKSAANKANGVLSDFDDDILI